MCYRQLVSLCRHGANVFYFMGQVSLSVCLSVCVGMLRCVFSCSAWCNVTDACCVVTSKPVMVSVM